jgi:hypothetical protein
MNGAADSQPQPTAVSSGTMKRGMLLSAAAAAFFVAGANARPFKTEFKSKLLDFEYGWSTEANAIPALVKRFTADMRKQRASLTGEARSDAAQRRKQGFPFNAYQETTSITTAGESPRLLSLQIDTYAFTGGAHGNSGTTALLWDRRLVKQIAFNSLFRPNSGFITAFRGPYCRALDAERAKRRQGEKLGGDFDKCPAFSELALIPADTNHNGRFDHLLLIAAPYVAAPYVEGEYEISLPVNTTQTANLKAEYRSSFGT